MAMPDKFMAGICVPMLYIAVLHGDALDVAAWLALATMTIADSMRDWKVRGDG